MKILVLYGTTEGQTRKIAEFVAKKLRGYGDDVTLVDAAASPPALSAAGYDAAILAASLHLGRYQAGVAHFARANQERLNRIPALFLSVSLSAAGSDPDDLKGIAECARQFKAETGWSGAEVHHIAGAFRFTEYDFFKRLALKLIAWQKGVKVDASKDVEFTNWDELSAIVDAFRAHIAPRSETRKAG